MLTWVQSNPRRGETIMASIPNVDNDWRGRSMLVIKTGPNMWMWGNVNQSWPSLYRPLAWRAVLHISGNGAYHFLMLLKPYLLGTVFPSHHWKTADSGLKWQKNWPIVVRVHLNYSYFQSDCNFAGSAWIKPHFMFIGRLLAHEP
jgi:hypothetical protein